ncbi:MAG: KH domain-containing protein [Candidatus Micrarchaeota archaeon]|nr:KH domain-containing protein [Candidatus Micrarchaeota archaeon]
MKTPIPEEEIRSGVLSQETKRKIEEGKISKLDLEVAQILYKINERYNISAAEFSKAIDLGRAILILTKGEAGVLIGKQGKVVAELSSALGKKVRIAEMRGDLKKSIADIIAPAKLLGINQVFHQGKEITKVRISKAGMAHLPIDLPTLESALRSLMEREVQLVIE